MGASKNQKNTYNEMGREEKYISLKEAAQYSRVYSQDYLSLRARQGKLQAVKMGRNWVTKKEWIDQYLNEVNEFKNGKQKEVKEAPVRDKKTDKEIAKILKPKKTSFIFRKKKAIGLVLGSLLLISLFSFGYSKYEPVLEKLGKGIEQVSSKITLSLARLVFISSDKDETIPPDEDYVKQKTKEDITVTARIGKIKSEVFFTTTLVFSMATVFES